jgi:DNA-binding response OmpR family regulator
MAARVLVADDDLWILRMISTVLERRGHSVTLASDGAEALAAAITSPPDLLITDINMPRMDGWELIEALRERDNLADLPVIVLSELTDEDSRVRGYKLGVEDYVAKPFRFDELDLRVSKSLRRPTTGSDVDSDEPADVGLVGSLDQVSLSSLLTMFELDAKTGLLQLARFAAPTARLWMRKGRVVAAELDGSEDLSDAERVYQLLTWTAGRFEFHAQPVELEDRIKRRTTALLMEGARRIDEASR